MAGILFLVFMVAIGRSAPTLVFQAIAIAVPSKA